MVLNWDPTPHGSIDIEVATSYYTPGIPSRTEVPTLRWQSRTKPVGSHPPHCTEVLTHRWHLRTKPLGPHPARGNLVLDPWDPTRRTARKYRHIGGIFVLHPWDPTPHASIDIEVAGSRVRYTISLNFHPGWKYRHWGGTHVLDK